MSADEPKFDLLEYSVLHVDEVFESDLAHHAYSSTHRNLQQPEESFQEQQQQQQQQQQFDPNFAAPQQNYYTEQQPPPQVDPYTLQNQQQQYYGQQTTNTEQFYNSFMDKFNGFAGGEINGATDVNVSDAMTSFGFNATLFLVLLAAYEFMSRLIPSVYSRRKLHVSDDRFAINIPRSAMPFSWVPSVVRASWSTVQKCGGLDAYFFLRFVKMCFKITAVSGLWGMIILGPVFATGGDGASGWYHFSMANVRRGSWRIWVPTLFMWFLTFFVLYVMNEEYRHYLDLRMQYLSEGDVDMNPQTQHSLMVENIPFDLRSDKALFQYFDTLYPGKIHSASIVLNIPDLEKVAAKRKRAVKRLEKSIAYYEAKGKRGTHVVGRKRCRCFGVETFPLIGFGGKMTRDEDEIRSPQRGNRVDSINYYRNQLTDLNEAVEYMQREKRTLVEEGNDRIRASVWISSVFDLASDVAAKSLARNRKKESTGLIVGFDKKKKSSSLFKQIFFDFFFGIFAFLNRNIDVVVDTVSGSTLSSTGFVTFNDMASVVAAAKSPLSHDPDVLTVSIAPDPREIIWENAHLNIYYCRGREWTANIIIGFGAILWSTVVASIQAWATVDRLATVPGLYWMEIMNISPTFTSFVNGYLPVVALLGIISLLPLIFQKVAQNFENRKTKSDIQHSIMGRYFYYQLANIYVTVTAGSIWTSLGTILDHPGSIFEIMGKSIPHLVGFFVTLLVTKTLAGLPIIQLRLGSLLRQTFLRVLFRQKFMTQRELDEVYRREPLLGGWEYPNILFVVVICFTYACISPIILPFGAIFFLGALIVYKKDILLVYTPAHESGGTMFPSACTRVLIGLICGQVTLIGYTILQSSFYQPLVLLPLPFITYFMINEFGRIYQSPSEILSLERATQIDQKSMVKIRFDEDLYRQPVMAEQRLEPLPYRVSLDSLSMSSSISPVGVLHTDIGNKIV